MFIHKEAEYYFFKIFKCYNVRGEKAMILSYLPSRKLGTVLFVTLVIFGGGFLFFGKRHDENESSFKDERIASQSREQFFEYERYHR